MTLWKVEDKNSQKTFEIDPSTESTSSTDSIAERRTTIVGTKVVTSYCARRKDAIQVWLNGRIFEYKVLSPEEQMRQLLKQQDHGSDSELVAKMPGKVLSVKVKPGETVQPNQTLLIIEAMKMENHISIPKKAVVADVKISAQQVVEAGQVLVTFQA